MTSQPHPNRSTLGNSLRAFTVLSLVGVVLTGCASHKFVRKHDETVRADMSEEIGNVASGLEQTQGDLAALDDTVTEQGEQIDELSQTSREALERALAAGKLAEGKFLYETLLTDDAVKFGFEKASLSDEAKQALDGFAAELRERDENVYVEIQGHTDSTGNDSFNLELGERRAESVRRYLSLEHGVPLHRMGIISYGETAPMADNQSREGRASNRRVALVVLR